MIGKTMGKQSLAVRLVSIVACAALALSMGALAPLTAMAADAGGDTPAATTYSVTVTDPQGTNAAAHQYKIYQIVTGTVGDASTTGAATQDQGGHNIIEKSIENPVWGSSVKSAIGTSGTALTPTQYATLYSDIQTMTAEIADGEHNSKNDAVEAFLTKYVNMGAPADTQSSSNGSTVFDGLQPGYYLVAEGDTSDAEYNVSTVHILKVVGQNVTVAAKSSLPSFTKTVVEGNNEGTVADACFGEAVTYNLKFTLPTTVTDYENYVISIADTMSTGLVFDQVTSATLGTTDISEGITKPAAGATGDLTFGYTIANPTSAMAGQVVTITYTAHMNGDAVLVDDGNPNTAEATYSNNPYGEGTGKTPSSTTTVHAYQLDVNKLDDANNPLSGVTFELYKSGSTDKISFVQESAGVYHVASTGEQGAVTSLANGSDGKLHLKGLDAGSYNLKEIDAPDGYEIKDAETTVTITAAYGTDQATTSLAATVADNTYASVDSSYATNAVETGIVGVKVENPKQLDMPITGEQGLMIVTVIGVALVAISGGSMLRNRRRDSDEA